MKYYQRIKDLREDADKTQEDIAKLLKTSTQYYGQYELNKRPLTIEHLITLCKYYNVSSDYIIGFTNIQKPMPNDKEEKKESKTIKITGYNINIQNL